MLESHKVLVRMSEIREKANGLPQTDASFSESEKLRAELVEMESQYREALDAETEVSDAAMASWGANGSNDPENRERQKITGKADLGVLVGALIGNRALQVGSAEAECQASWGVGGDCIPVAMLAEYRVAAAPADGGGDQRFVGYRFPTSIAEFANIRRVRVQPGTPVFPSITTASVANRPDEAAQSTDSDPTLRGELLTPKRVQASTKISVEDRARFGGMSQAIARHLSEAVAAGLDQQALLGDDGFFDASSGPLTEPNSPGSATTQAQYDAMLTGSVDGRYAENEAAVGLLIHPDTFTDGAALYLTTNSERHVMADLAARGRLRVSAAMPAAASNVQNILAVRGTTPAAVQPIWDDLRIEDVVTRSEYGEIGFTIIGIADFSVTMPDAYRWLKANLS